MIGKRRTKIPTLAEALDPRAISKAAAQRWDGIAPIFSIGDKVSKVGGDYRFDGVVRSVFAKGSGEVRIVVEDDRGILFIARPDMYRRRK